MKSAEEVLERLQNGNARFVADSLDGKLTDSNRRISLTSGQQPDAIILSCADSRVVPELLFDTGLGELFVVRVAGNIANTSSVASIEYAVANLGCPVLMVLGHQGCGAVMAAISGGDLGENLNHLLAHITPAVIASGNSSDVDAVVKINAQLTGEELRTKSSIIDDAVAEGTLTIVPAFYSLESGRVEML